MKTNNALFIVALMSLLFHSCDIAKNPQMWKDEIEDVFRYKISLATAYIDNYYTESMLDYIDEQFEKYADSIYNADIFTEKFAMYDSTLCHYKSVDHIEKLWADYMYDIYKKINVDFDTFKEKNKEDGLYVWESIEKNTNIKITFKIDPLSKWELTLDENDLENYLSETIDKALSKNKEEIKNRIISVYNGDLKDEEIMSAGFYRVFHRAQISCKDEIGWPDYDYWRCTQDIEPTVKIEDIELDYPIEDAIVFLTLDYGEDCDIKKVELPMIYEREKWFVDDIITITNRYRDSLKETAEDILSSN